jgi:O-methyltransferase
LLVEESKKSQGAFLEVGTWRGGSGAIIASHAQQLGLTEKVYLCDTFKGVVKTGEKDSSYYGGEHADTSYSTVSALMKKLNLKNVEILEGVFPDETGVHIEDEVFRFCHIDVDVYLSAKEIIEWVWPRLSNGGIVVFDDYGFKTCDGITRFVNEESKSLDRRFVYNLNGHSIWIKVP